MHTEVMKWVSISALLMAVSFWSSASNYQVELCLVVFVIAPFAMSLVALRPRPLLSIPSITSRNPGSRSL